MRGTEIDKGHGGAVCSGNDIPDSTARQAASHLLSNEIPCVGCWLEVGQGDSGEKHETFSFGGPIEHVPGTPTWSHVESMSSDDIKATKISGEFQDGLKSNLSGGGV